MSLVLRECPSPAPPAGPYSEARGLLDLGLVLYLFVGCSGLALGSGTPRPFFRHSPQTSFCSSLSSFQERLQPTVNLHTAVRLGVEESSVFYTT
jgi:hypothetical protein